MSANPIISSIVEFLQHNQAVFAALALTVATLVAISRGLKQLWEDLRGIVSFIQSVLRRARKRDESPAVPARPRGLHLVLVGSFAALGVSLLLAAELPRDAPKLPRSVELMKGVWDSFNVARDTRQDRQAAEYRLTIEKADKLLKEFEPGASAEQAKLIELKEEVPGDGSVGTKERARIWQFGPMNEVAAAWFVRGQSFEALGDQAEALSSYEHAERYPHARVFDPSGDAFWSPATEAKARADALLGDRKDNHS